MKLAIVGSRTFKDFSLMDYWVDILLPDKVYSGHTIISGGAKGADEMAEKIAKQSGTELIVFKPDWNKHGKSAGHMRNMDIISHSDQVLAFWDGKSKGTASSLSIAKFLKKPTVVVYF